MDELQIGFKSLNGILRVFSRGRAGQVAHVRFISTMKWMLAAAILLIPVAADSQTPEEAAHRWRVAHEQQILEEFAALLSIPNVSSDTSNIRRNADALVEALARVSNRLRTT